MKIYIGPYKNWVGPYQIAEALCFWAKNVEDEYKMGFKFRIKNNNDKKGRRNLSII